MKHSDRDIHTRICEAVGEAASWQRMAKLDFVSPRNAERYRLKAVRLLRGIDRLGLSSGLTTKAAMRAMEGTER
jgi:hypothetical protein